MRTPALTCLTLALLLSAPAFAADEPAVDAAKYPQDTPAAALGSIIKALEGLDFPYYAAWMLIPADKERILKKYETLSKFADSKKAADQAQKIRAQTALMKKILEENKVTEGQTGDVKWARFEFGVRILQLEKQADGRWAMNANVTTKEGAKPEGEEKK